MKCVQIDSACCGCAACAAICPRNAIAMVEDKSGFVYPKVDSALCVECGLCAKVCPMITPSEGKKDVHVFAAVNRNEKMRQSSASGGAFTALAQWIFDKGGVVIGCAWDDNLMPEHTVIQSMASICKLQGSKYVQSNLAYVYQQVKDYLKNDQYVLFSGTPCQCAAIRAYLGKPYDKLFCVELICHGVPNARIFRNYLDLLEKRYGGKIIYINFRDKKLGWGALMRIDYLKNGIHHTKYLKPEESYYYYHFFYKALFYRESCYQCRYASENRQSDFTIGDYWGAERSFPELGIGKGISVLIATGEKATAALPEIQKYAVLVEADINDVREENGQLSHPSSKSEDYASLLGQLIEYGPEEFDALFRRSHRKEVMMGKVKRLLLPVKRFLRTFIG